jgi:hypothetical protein
LVLEVEEQDRRRLSQLDEQKFRRLLDGSSWLPLRVAAIGESTLWLFREQFLWDDGEWFSQADVHAEMDRRRARPRGRLVGDTRASAVAPVIVPVGAQTRTTLTTRVKDTANRGHPTLRY